MVSFPLTNKKILVRLENLADVFDGVKDPAVVDLNLIYALLKDANPNLNGRLSVEWREVSVTGNMEIGEM